MQFFNRITNYSSEGQSYNTTLYYQSSKFDVWFMISVIEPVSWETGSAGLLHLAFSKAYFVLYQPKEISTAK